MPSNFPAMAVIFPSRSMAFLRGRPYSFHQWTSCLSPKVQIMTAPVPKVGSTAASVRTGTFWPKKGTVSSLPWSRVNRSSSGWTATATQAARSSGRVVAISTPSKRKVVRVVSRSW